MNTIFNFDSFSGIVEVVLISLSIPVVLILILICCVIYCKKRYVGNSPILNVPM